VHSRADSYIITHMHVQPKPAFVCTTQVGQQHRVISFTNGHKLSVIPLSQPIRNKPRFSFITFGIDDEHYSSVIRVAIDDFIESMLPESEIPIHKLGFFSKLINALQDCTPVSRGQGWKDIPNVFNGRTGGLSGNPVTQLCKVRGVPGRGR